jgi:hypothetical protein
MKIITGLPSVIIAVLCFWGCPTMPQYVESTKYTNDFQPIPPFRLKVVTYSSEKHKMEAFTGFSSYVSVQKMDMSGSANFSSASITGDAGSYTVIMDFVAYDIIPIQDEKNHVIAYGRNGVGLRVTANIVTSSSKLNVSGLPNLAAEAKASHLSGTLTVDVIGISSKDVINLIPLSSEIDQTSIGTILQALAGIKAKIFDDQTTVSPYLLSLRKTTTDIQLSDVTNEYISGFKRSKPISLLKNELIEHYSKERLSRLKASIDSGNYPELKSYFSGDVDNLDQFTAILNNIYLSQRDFDIYILGYAMEAMK